MCYRQLTVIIFIRQRHAACDPHSDDGEDEWHQSPVAQEGCCEGQGRGPEKDVGKEKWEYFQSLSQRRTEFVISS